MKKLFLLVLFCSLFITQYSFSQWVQYTNGMPYTYPAYSLGKAGNIMFAGVGGFGVYRSSNFGVNWSLTTLTSNYPNDFTSFGDTVIAGIGTYNDSGLYISTNSGLIWNKSNYYLNVMRLFISGDTIYCGTFHSGVWRSTNKGNSWTQTTLSNVSVFALTKCGNCIFAGLYYPNHGIYRSTNNGETWSMVGLNNLEIMALATNNEYVYAGSYDVGTSEGGIYLSTNYGINWIQTKSLESVLDIEINGNFVFASLNGTPYTNSWGVWCSTNSGFNWINKNWGFVDTYHIYDLIINGDYIFASTEHSVWRRNLSEIVITESQNQNNEIPNEFNLFQNYPNPFNPNTKINYQISKLTNVKMVVYDATGKLVSTLVNKKQSPGTYEVTFDGSNLPSGIYFYKLETENYTQTKKMILIK